MTTLHELVEEQARSRPDAVAVSAGGTSVGYRELDDWADTIAARLTEAGVRPGDLVAVMVPRSPTFPAAVLGILKAGAAYVPVDPDYPVLRREHLLSDAAPTAVVVGGIGIGDVRRDLPRVSAEPPDAACAPSPHAGRPRAVAADLAYVMYTSGSSGKPKGVAVEHRQVVSLALNDERIRVRPGDRVVMMAPLSFDASTFELWNTLCRGGELVVPDGTPDSVSELSSLLGRTRPDWLFLTTGLFHLVADHDPRCLSAVGTLITGGDVLSPRQLAVAARNVREAVYAAYGPTEATTFTTLHRVDPDEPLGAVPLGTPLHGREVRVLGPGLSPVRPGEVGEICIGGVGLARGYLGRPELTAERFVWGASGTRLYRSGDLGRWRPDGALMFHGRMDRQVKIRGHRVEPGEIESYLDRHPAVAASAVTAPEDGTGAKRLVAYVVPAKESLPTTRTLREWIREGLPSYLEPASIVMIESMPLDAHGKPDRAHLPSPFTCRDDLEGLPPYRAPGNDAERTIVTALAEALDLDRVGVDDDFAALGGDSLRSIDVLARLRRSGLEFQPGDFFVNPTAAGLAAALGGEPRARRPA